MTEGRNRPPEVGPQAFSLILYSRPGCHLCDDARKILVRLGAPFTEVDIEADEALHASMLERIPVVALDGEELFEHFVDEDMLQARLDGPSDPVE